MIIHLSMAHAKIFERLRFICLLIIIAPASLFSRQSTKTIVDSLRRELRVASGEQRLAILNDLSWELAEVSPVDALELAKAQLALSDSLRSDSGRASAYGNIAGAVWSMGDLDQAIMHYQEGIAIRGRLGDRKGVANYLNNIGIIYRNLGNYSRSVEAYLQALRTYEAIGEKGKVLGNAYNNLGIVYKNMGELSLAKGYYKKALEVYQTAGYQVGIAYGHLNLGDIKRKEQQYTVALTSFERSLKEFRETTNAKGIGHAMLGLADTYQALNQIEKASLYLDSAKAQYKQIGSDSDLGTVLIGQARLAFMQQKTDEGLGYAAEAYRIGRSIKAPKVVRDAAQTLSEGYHARGAYEKAYDYQKTYQQVNDSMLSEEVSKQVANISKSHEIELRELEIQTLKQDQKIRQYQNYSLLGGLLLLILLSSVLFNRYRLKKKANKELNIKNTEILGQKEEIQTQRDQIEGQRDQILEQSYQLQEANEQIQLAFSNIKDSINYAARIQVALLGDSKRFGKNFSDAFALWKPKDGISGDFYWEYQLPATHPTYPKHSIIVCADCTGHGVPGAMMTVMGNALLNEIIKVNQQGETATILKELDRKVRLSLSQSEENGREDGMDMSIVRLNPAHTELEFAGAKSDVLLVGEGGITRFRGSRVSIGGRLSQGFDKEFSSESISLEKHDIFYLHSDGYPDQFGTDGRGKFLPKRMRAMIESISHLPMYTQKEKLDEAFEEWKGDGSQTDDVLVIGVKV